MNEDQLKANNAKKKKKNHRAEFNKIKNIQLYCGLLGGKKAS